MVEIKQTDDKELLAEIIKQLEANNYICPCSIRKDSQLDRCMCQDFREIINDNVSGVYTCNCGRYIITIQND
jgi:hypothetical protein